MQVHKPTHLINLIAREIKTYAELVNKQAIAKAAKPGLWTEITPQYAQDMAEVYGILSLRITQLREKRNLIVRSMSESYESNLNRVDCDNQIKELVALRGRFYKRLKTAQRKVTANG